VAAMLGLSILLLLGVLDWDDCLNEKSAWDTLAWFAVLVGMAGQLTNLGIVSWMSSCVAKLLQSFSLSWPAAFCVLEVSYFLIHYLFASQTGHVGALYSAFLAMHIAAGVPRVLSALALAFNTNLFGALTHYSSGQAAVYFGGKFSLSLSFPPSVSLLFFAPELHFSGYSLAIILTCHFECIYPSAFAHRV
jgi:di/tricarboxylate transporter